VALAIVVAAVLHVVLPAKYRVDPAWVVPAVLLALLAALIIGDPGRIDRQKAWLRIVTGAVIAFITVTNLFAAVHLIVDILTNNKLFASNATGLLATGGVIWATNVIAFGLWYWDLDCGGAAARAHQSSESIQKPSSPALSLVSRSSSHRSDRAAEYRIVPFRVWVSCGGLRPAALLTASR